MSILILTSTIIISFLLPFYITNLLIPKLIKFGYQKNIIDLPEERKHHVKPLVRLGGVALAIGISLPVFILGITLNNYAFINNGEITKNLLVIICAFAMFLLGISDDVYNLSPKFRLFMQFFIIFIIWNFGFKYEHITLITNMDLSIQLNKILSYIFIMFWIVGVTNSINWIDGLDGLAIGNVIAASITICLINLLSSNYFSFLVSLSLLSSSLAFLRFNKYQAKIYMGDGGSYFLGSLLAFLVLLSSNANSNFGGDNLNVIPFIPFFILFIPIADMVVVIFQRLMDGNSPFYPDRGHLHHKLLRSGYSHKNTVKIIYLFSFFSSSISFLFLDFNKLFLLTFFIGLFVFSQLCKIKKKIFFD